MNRKAIRTALISRVDISDNFSNAHTFDVDVLEQSPNLADHLNDLINSADKEKLTPFQEMAKSYSKTKIGGKMDDITVIVGQVERITLRK